MQITERMLSKYGAAVHYVLSMVARHPERLMTLREIATAPWTFHRSRPSQATLRKTLYDLIHTHKLLQREQRGVYCLAQGVTFSDEALGKLLRTRPPCAPSEVKL